MTAILSLLLSALSVMACTISPAYAGQYFDDRQD